MSSNNIFGLPLSGLNGLSGLTNRPDGLPSGPGALPPVPVSSSGPGAGMAGVLPPLVPSLLLGPPCAPLQATGSPHPATPPGQMPFGFLRPFGFSDYPQLPPLSGKYKLIITSWVIIVGFAIVVVAATFLTQSFMLGYVKPQASSSIRLHAFSVSLKCIIWRKHQVMI